MYLEKDKQLDTKSIVDEIEKAVYAEVKVLGFKKHGRTLHRFADGDLSQVINFQNGCAEKGFYDVLWVNIGIRIPECDLHRFAPEEKIKKYYRESECTLRARLGEVDGNEATEYDLHGSVDEIKNHVTDQIKTFVLPAFEALNNRSAILKNDINTPCLDGLKRELTPLEETMVWGRLEEKQIAEETFRRYYADTAEKCKEKAFSYMKPHLTYLEELAEQLQIRITNTV